MSKRKATTSDVYDALLRRHPCHSVFRWSEWLCKELMLRHPDRVPVAVSGSTDFEYESGPAMREACELLAHLFVQMNGTIAVTGGMPGVAELLGNRFESAGGESGRLFHVLPTKHDPVPKPSTGQSLLLGNSFIERQLILGCSALVLVLIGGGPGSAREANVMLSWGGIVIPIAATGGAARGEDFEMDYDPLASQLDLTKAERNAVGSSALSGDEWKCCLEGSVAEAIDVCRGFLSRLTDAAHNSGWPMTQREPESDRRDLVGRGEWTHEAVPPGCECPSCREWCMDLLVWLDDDIVRCTTCGTRYNPTTGQVAGYDDQAD